MILLPDFTPRDVVPPVRNPITGVVQLGRKTATHEQYTEAVARAKEILIDKRETEGRVKVLWSRGEPTILEVRIRIEHVTMEDEDGEKRKVAVPVLDKISQHAINGAEIRETRAQKSARLVEEVTEMAREGQFS